MQSASTNITTFPGKVGVSNANPIHTLDIASNVYVDDAAATKLRVYGNIHASNLTVDGGITVVETDNLSVKDPVLLLASGSTGTSDTGIIMKRADGDSNVTIFYDEGVGLNVGHTLSRGDEIHLSIDTANALTTSVYGPVNVVNSGTQALSVDGGAKIDGGAQIDGNLQIGAVSNLFVNTATSNVGIGTTSPAYKLEVNGKVGIQEELKAAYDADTASYFGRAAVGYMGQSDQASFSHIDKNTSTNFALKQAASGATHLNTPTGQHVRFSVNAVEVGRFTGGGDFKVGANKLYVDTSASEVQMYSQDTGSTAGPDLVLMRNNPNNGANADYIGQVRYEGLSDSGTSRLYAKTTGKIKTATNGSESGIIETALRTGGSQRISVRHSGDLFHIKNGTDFRVGESFAYLYVDTSAGNVGIGLSNPSYKLDVSGDINFTGSLLQNGAAFQGSKWTTSGSDIYRPSGNVGIGTSSPGDMLHVYKNGYTPRVTIETPGAHDAELKLKNSNGQWVFRCLDSSGSLELNNSSGLAFAISQSKNVGVGATLSPSGKFQVRIGNASVPDTPWDSTKVVFGDITSGNSQGLGFGVTTNSHASIISIAPGVAWRGLSYWAAAHNWYTGGTHRMTMNSSGNVGIGTASPGKRLEILTDTDWDGWMVKSSTNTHGYLQKDGTGTAFGMNESSIRKVYIRTNADSYFNGGNVGIGTGTPGRALEVYTGNGTVPGLRLRRGSGAAYTDLRHADTPDGLAIHSSDGNATTLEVMRICGFGGGKVGIGTTNPSARLHVQGDQYIIGPEEGHGGTGHLLLKENTTNAGEMRIGVNRAYGFIDTHGSNQSLRINTNYGGNVGIDERNPTEKLHVDGNILASGNVTAYSDKRIKSDILKIENALDKIEKLNGYTYTVKDERYTGLIAQEVLPVLPEAVTGSEETQYGLAYGNMMGLVVEAIKELREEIKNVRFFARL